jgi:hypothetical protein
VKDVGGVANLKLKPAATFWFKFTTAPAVIIPRPALRD